MEGQVKQVIRQKITDALAATVPAHTRRHVQVPGIKGKAMAVIGMRRSGKTTFLWQCLADRFKAGTPRVALLYFNFEDERLAEMTAHELTSAPISPRADSPNRKAPPRATVPVCCAPTWT